MTARHNNIKGVSEDLRKTTEELSHVSDAFTSLAAQLEDVFKKVLEDAEDLDVVSQSIAKSYQ